ncbi:MAG: hypothetical protein AAF687_02955 [Pseudomonadota bacterium]
MKVKAKILAVGVAAVMTSGCTYDELRGFAIGATVAAVAISASQEAHDSRDDFSRAYGPTSCPSGYSLDLAYDDYGDPVRFCAHDDAYFSQSELNALAEQAE